jgi:protease I
VWLNATALAVFSDKNVGILRDNRTYVLVEPQVLLVAAGAREKSLTFQGHEYKVPFECHETFEGMSDEELRSYSAIIVPSAIVSDRLRYTEDLSKLAPACEFLKRAFGEPGILKGIFCHGMWLVSPMPELVRGRRVVAHPNLYGDVRNMGAVYTDEDVVVDGDLVTARTGGHCHQFARRIIDILGGK